VEEGGGWRYILAPLEIRIDNVAGDGAAGEGAPKRRANAFIQKRGEGDGVEIADGQTVHVERGCEDGGAERRDFEIMIFEIRNYYNLAYDNFWEMIIS